MHVIFVEPAFPANQMEFVRALHSVGARVTGIGERPMEALPDELKHQMIHYERVGNVTDEDGMVAAVRRIQGHLPVDRMEATVEAHVLPVAKVREECGIPGTSVRTTWICRDKPTMKDVLREAGIATAQSLGAKTADEAREFAKRVGYPLILKPRGGAGASGTCKADNDGELEQAIEASGLAHGQSVAVEEFVEGHEGFYDTLTVNGQIRHDFVTHYFPNVLEAMRTRWISPQFVVTNRIDTVEDYAQVREMGKRVIEAIGIDTAPTHMEWFFGPQGLKFSEIGCRPPGVRVWDLYSAGNGIDLYREWAQLLVHGRTEARASRRFAAGMIALRPDRDGRISGYEGVEEVRREYGGCIIDACFPPPGTATQSEQAGYMANAWMRLRDPDLDTLRGMLDDIGRRVQVRAR